MQVVYTSAIKKDVKGIKDQKVIHNLKRITDSLEKAPDLAKVSYLKKLKNLKGNPPAFRIRLGTYRLCFFLEANTIILARFVKRDEGYDSLKIKKRTV